MSVSSGLTSSSTYQNRGTLNITYPQSGVNRPTVITTNYTGTPTSAALAVRLVNTTTGGAWPYGTNIGTPVYDFTAVAGTNSYQIQIASLDGTVVGLSGAIFYAMQY